MERLRWSAQRPGERLLRVWLGGTFTYAGVQKLADPDFLREGGTTYIGDQLEGFAQGSPIGPLLDLAANAPQLTGVATAVTEIVIGLATLAGIAPAAASLVGALLSISLWLSASWQVYPYFLGSDSIYAVAWIAYGLSLPSTAAAIVAVREKRRPDLLPASTPDLPDERRRSLLRGSAVVGGGVVLAGLAGLVGRSRSSDATTSSGSTAPSSTPTSTPTESVATASPSPTGEVITDVATLRTEGSFDFQDGDAVLVALADGSVAAFSRRCTHSGCTADYDTNSRMIVCPCHGSRFDPAEGGTPINGPATRPLDEIPVEIDSTGVVRRA